MKLHVSEPGRYILFLGREWQHGDPTIRLEVSRTYNFGLGWKVSREEQELQFSGYFFKLFSFWLTFESRLFKYISDPTNTGILWNPLNHTIHTELFSKKEMDSSKPAIINKYWNYADWLFGRSIYSESRHNTGILGLNNKHTLAMPEGEYTIELDFYASYWHRPRSPFIKKLDRVEIKPNRGVPIPGKGENSWDLDDDAIYSSTEQVKGRTPEQIVEDFKEHIFETRARYATRDWQPTKEATR